MLWVMEQLLVKAGLNSPQAHVYLYLLKVGEASPPAIARATNLSRTNAYKVLERLAELGLVREAEVAKKIVYRPEDPSALASLVAEERNRVIALEHDVNQAMQRLRAIYRKSTGDSQVEKAQGKTAILESYKAQADQRETIYFIKSRFDIPFMGYDTMEKLRGLPAKAGTQRYGLTPYTPEAKASLRDDDRMNLRRTWVPAEEYTAPVEWSVSGDKLYITVFEGRGRIIKISDSVIADSFKQIWDIADKRLKKA